jgi:hypothetical protein
VFGVMGIWLEEGGWRSFKLWRERMTTRKSSLEQYRGPAIIKVVAMVSCLTGGGSKYSSDALWQEYVVKVLECSKL